MSTQYPTEREEQQLHIAQLSAEVAALRAALAEQEVESHDLHALRERMADLLTRTAIALRGEPEPLHSHGWSDLPERAAAMRVALEQARDLVTEADDALANLSPSAESIYYGEVHAAESWIRQALAVLARSATTGSTNA